MNASALRPELAIPKFKPAIARQWHEMADRQLVIDEALTGLGTV
jgi:hypothetical protein